MNFFLKVSFSPPPIQITCKTCAEVEVGSQSLCCLVMRLRLEGLSKEPVFEIMIQSQTWFDFCLCCEVTSSLEATAMILIPDPK